MSETSAQPTIEAMITHVEWVRRLARQLVADTHDAEEIEQETWRHSLERPPPHCRQLRYWLAAVAHNVARRFVRAEEARQRHERAVPIAESMSNSTPGSVVHEVIARAELHRRVVDALLALDDLYRVPLLLRFFDDLPSHEVALRLAVPVETARTRIKRGLALVRARLNAQLGLEGRDWVAALAPLLLPGGQGGGAVTAGAACTSTTIGLMLGGAFMSNLVKVGIAVVVAGVAVFGSYQAWIAPRVAKDREVETSNAISAPPVPATVDPERLPEPAVTASSREVVDHGKSQGTTATASLGVIEGTVFDSSGHPVAGAIVALDRLGSSGFWDKLNYRRVLRQFLNPGSREHTWRSTTSASDGTFRFDEIDPSKRWALGAIHDPLGSAWNESIELGGMPPCARAALVLEPGVVLFGSVRDPLGKPVAVASVMLRGSIARPDEGENGFSSDFEDFVNSSEDGSYRSLPLPWRYVRVHVYVHAGRPDLAQLDLPWKELPVSAVEVRSDLTVPTLMTLRGRILDPDGAPARLLQTVAPRLGADARGPQSKDTIVAVALAVDPRVDSERIERLPPGGPEITYLDPDFQFGTIEVDEDRYEIPLRHEGLRFVAIVARKRLLGVAEIPISRTTLDVVIDPSLVPERSLVHSLRLHFRDGRDSSPLPGVGIFAIATTRTGEGQLIMSILNFRSEDLSPDRDLELPLTPLSIRMELEGFMPRTCLLNPSRVGAPKELTFEFFPAVGSIAVHLEDEGGEPIAGASLRIYRNHGGVDFERVMLRPDRPTDEHGECTVAGLAAGEFLVVAQKDGYAPSYAIILIDDEGATPADLMMERGYEVILKSRLADGAPAPAGMFMITSEEGVPIYDLFHPGYGAANLASKKIRLTDGNYTIHCDVPATAEGRADFVAAPGATIEVELKPTQH